jgi:hypothetical protein
MSGTILCCCWPRYVAWVLFSYFLGEYPKWWGACCSRSGPPLAASGTSTGAGAVPGKALAAAAADAPTKRGKCCPRRPCGGEDEGGSEPKGTASGTVAGGDYVAVPEAPPPSPASSPRRQRTPSPPVSSLSSPLSSPLASPGRASYGSTSTGEEKQVGGPDVSSWAAAGGAAESKGEQGAAAAAAPTRRRRKKVHKPQLTPQSKPKPPMERRVRAPPLQCVQK